MTDETLRTLITCGFTFGGIVISNSFVYLSSKSKEKKSKQDSITEQQYKKVFTPIHKLLFFVSASETKKIDEINSIIYDNYELVADEIRDSFEACLLSQKITEDFEKLINSCYKVLGTQLGYANLKIDKEDRKSTKRVISSKWYFIRYINITTIILAVIEMILIFSIALLFVYLPEHFDFVIRISLYSVIMMLTISSLLWFIKKTRVR